MRLSIHGVVYHPDRTSNLVDVHCFSVQGVAAESFVAALLDDMSPGHEVGLPDPHDDCSRRVRRTIRGHQTRRICHGSFTDPWRDATSAEAMAWLRPAAEYMIARKSSMGGSTGNPRETTPSGELGMREDASPEAMVEAFIQAMNYWERRALHLSRAARNSADPSSCLPEIRATMDSVFATYRTPRERPHGRQGSFQKPPQYDPGRERIVRAEIDQDRAHVETDRVSPLGGGAYRYTLHRRAHRWLIDTVKRQDGERWVPDTL